MIKGIATVKKKVGMENDEFHRYWRKTHGPLALKMSKLRGYVQSHRSDESVPGFEECPYDGVAEVWFDDLETMQSLSQDPEYVENAMRDEPNFADLESLKFLCTEERLIIDDPQPASEKPPVKAIFLISRKDGMSVSEFQDYWFSEHAPQIPRDAGVARYTQCHQVQSTYETGSPAYDGVAELSFRDIDAFRDYWLSDRVQAIFAADAPRFLHPEKCTAFLSIENRLR